MASDLFDLKLTFSLTLDLVTLDLVTLASLGQ